MDNSAKGRLTAATTKLLLLQPFFGSLLMRLEPVETEAIGTMGTDSVVLAYSPKFVESLSNTDLMAILCHEVLHVVLKHPFRRNTRNRDKWNIATDYAVNDIVKSDVNELILPSSALYDPRYHDMTADHIYALLPKKDSKESVEASQMGKVIDYNQKSHPPDGKGSQDDKAIGDSCPGEGKYEKTPEAQSDSWDSYVASAIISAKSVGKGSSNFILKMQAGLEPKISWQEYLANCLTIDSRNDYCWRMPNRRYLSSGVILPSLNSPTLEDIIIIVDTSGSIDDKDLSRFASELQSILFTYPGTSLKVIYVDAGISSMEEITIDCVEFHPSGGGGTDFRPGFDYIKREQLNPSAIIYFTDGYCSSYPEDPGIPVYWISTGAKMNVPFGTLIMYE